jgi:hypothetical protein
VSRIPQDDAARKAAPLYRCVFGYFPAAVFELAAHCLDSDRKHNPDAKGDPTWARGKSTDHEDCQLRHLIDAGPRRDSDRFVPEPPPAGSSAKDARRYHLRANFWRAAALLQEDCELDGAEPGVASRFPVYDRLKAEKEGGPDLFDAATNQVLAPLPGSGAAQAFAAEAAEPKPERWGVFYRDGYGWDRSSSEPGTFDSEGAAVAALSAIPFTKRLPVEYRVRRLVAE